MRITRLVDVRASPLRVKSRGDGGGREYRKPPPCRTAINVFMSAARWRKLASAV